MKSEQQKNIVKAVGIVAVLLVLWYLLMRRTAGNTVVNPVVENEAGPDWLQMFYQTTPGILDNSVNNGPTFNSNNSVNVNTVDYNKLAGGYFPLFGFVGMTAVGN